MVTQALVLPGNKLQEHPDRARRVETIQSPVGAVRVPRSSSTWLAACSNCLTISGASSAA
jgi:hypothetical protein